MKKMEVRIRLGGVVRVDCYRATVEVLDRGKPETSMNAGRLATQISKGQFAMEIA